MQTGTGSTRQKKNLIVKLMRSCREKEIKFLVRTLVRFSHKYFFPQNVVRNFHVLFCDIRVQARNLRIGAMLRTVLPAVGRAIVMNSFWNCDNKEPSENFFREKLEVRSSLIKSTVFKNLYLIAHVVEKESSKFQGVSAAVVEAYNILPSLVSFKCQPLPSLTPFALPFSCETTYFF